MEVIYASYTLAVCRVQLMDQYPLCKYIYVGEKYSKTKCLEVRQEVLYFSILSYN